MNLEKATVIISYTKRHSRFLIDIFRNIPENISIISIWDNNPRKGKWNRLNELVSRIQTEKTMLLDADDVNLKGNIYFFIWEGTEQRAEVVRKKENKYIQFKWLDDPEEPTFEFRINIDELTGDVALVVTDTIDEGDDDDAIGLWDSQVAELKHVLGS